MVKYGLIGYPLGHSLSAKFFNEKFQREKISARYDLFPLENIGDLSTLIEETSDLKGLNVTIPYKERVIEFLSSISDEANEINAVNVIKIDKDKRLSGFNTDVIGFRESLRPLLKPDMKKALILGTGGASKAVAYALKTLDIEYIKVSRKQSGDIITYSDLNQEIIESHLLIVNTTPLGTWPKIEEFPSIPYQFLDNRHLCYDLVYNPSETLFLKKGLERGAMIKNGLEMLHKQALAAWDIWNS